MMNTEELQLLAQLRDKLQQAEMAISDLNSSIEDKVTDSYTKEALLIDSCLVGEAIADAKDLFEQIETFSTPVTEQTTALLANIGAAKPNPPQEQG